MYMLFYGYDTEEDNVIPSEIKWRIVASSPSLQTLKMIFCHYYHNHRVYVFWKDDWNAVVLP